MIKWLFGYPYDNPSGQESQEPKDERSVRVESMLLEAKRKLNDGGRKESEGKDKEALQDYRDGLELLVQAVKEETDKKKKEELSEITKGYFTRAEKLKAKLDSSSRPLARPKSVPTPHRSSVSGSSSSSSSSRASIPASPSVPAELRSQIESEILSNRSDIKFDTVIGMSSVKQALHEMVILPALRPDLFGGLRKPPRCLLLYGPPGNGKTFIAKAVSNEAKATFFSISASSLGSKNYGEGEKLVKALFAVAREKQPSIIFIDEIDSLLSKRSKEEHEASRRLKTEFLVQLDGVGTTDGDRVVVIGATNLPEELDDAVIRRFTKRVFIPNPDAESRAALLTSLLKTQKHSLNEDQFDKLVQLTKGYSNSDIKALCEDAAFGPLRELGPSQLLQASASQIKPISFLHFTTSLQNIRPSVSREKLAMYEKFHKENQK